MKETEAKKGNLPQYEFEFTGTGGDFFQIWIVNMLLSIITLGIYSPWAKVRNNQYLYGATLLNGDSFEYTANPIRILIGRFIVVGSYILYIIMMKVLGLQTFATIFLGIFLLAIPWLVRQAVCFKMRYTRYRGVNFSHHATVWQYYVFFIIHTILVLITIGLAFPYTAREFKDLIINNTSYGDKSFSFVAKTSLFYMAYLKLAGLLAIVYGSIILIIVQNVSKFEAVNKVEFPSMEAIFSIFGIVFLIYFVIILGTPFIRGVMSGWIGNIVNNSSSLNNFTFKSDWHPWRLGWIHLSNLLMNLFTLGLLTPWAKVRIMRHKLSHTYILGEGFDEFTNTQKEERRAIGEETADFFDFDVGF